MDKDKSRFKYHLDNDAFMRFFLREVDWKEWEATSVTEDMIVTSKAGIVSYPSGEAMFMYGRLHPTPDGIVFNNGPVYQDDRPDYTKNLLKAGQGKVSIEHGSSRSQDEDPSTHYSTRVTNLLDRKVRVFKFAPYSRGLFGRLFRECEGYYSPTQFREWFRVQDSEGWISPNETVCDPDNFGYGKGSWLYFFEDEFGEVFISSIKLTRN